MHTHRLASRPHDQRLPPANPPLHPPDVDLLQRHPEHRCHIFTAPPRLQRGHRPQPQGLPRRQQQTPRVPHQIPRTPPKTQKPNYCADEPNKKYVCDITYRAIDGGKFCYLATVIDLASRRLTGWAFADHMRAGPRHRRLGRSCPHPRQPRRIDFIERFYDCCHLREHKTFHYLAPGEAKQRHQHAFAAQKSSARDHRETSSVDANGSCTSSAATAVVHTSTAPWTSTS
ncbi:DDE-type integrase/transposase/recombinase [Streptomyces sp. NPDC059631]|uniref:DDE-type integrase/transposase/recombinase n=1 Tax=unclassified Streptomyces TaxID=2593676 RepID=UPI0036907F3A